MEKVYKILGKFLVWGAFVFLAVVLFVATQDPKESFARDIFGFPLNNPPEWLGMIPYIGFFANILYQMFSLHGLVGFVVFCGLLVLGYKLESLGENSLLESFEADRDEAGTILPTIKNKEFSKKLSKKYKTTEKMPKKLERIFLDINKADLSDSRRSNVFFKTREQAEKAIKRAELTNKLDEKILNAKENGYKIMQFEADPMLSEIYGKKLVSNGFEIKQFPHPSDNVIKQIKDYKPDLIITEIIMPEMDGFELIEKIRQNKKFNGIPIAVISNMSQDEDIKKALKLGANEYWVSSEYTPDEIVKNVKKIVGLIPS